jgi:hypothetical protein
MFVTAYLTLEEFKKAQKGLEFWGRLTPLGSFIVTLQIPVTDKMIVMGEAVQVLK